MAKHNYLVSVFVDGRNVNSYFSENLDDLVTIKAMHKDCDISIFDLQEFTTMPREQVESEIRKSGERWKKSMTAPTMPKTQVRQRSKGKQKRKKIKKYWERPVKCVETGQVFSSIRECSEHLGISHKSLWNAINSGKPRRGLHFRNATGR